MFVGTTRLLRGHSDVRFQQPASVLWTSPLRGDFASGKAELLSRTISVETATPSLLSVTIVAILSLGAIFRPG